MKNFEYTCLYKPDRAIRIKSFEIIGNRDSEYLPYLLVQRGFKDWPEKKVSSMKILKSFEVLEP